ncbi:hypothetical protein EDD17DRAFT_1565745 [Pisolithus thermaeus]|nr:hypothetical protein EDD17DRAFT_1565745 [Pisolithus thermaeus]
MDASCRTGSVLSLLGLTLTIPLRCVDSKLSGVGSILNRAKARGCIFLRSNYVAGTMVFHEIALFDRRGNQKSPGCRSSLS